jgi:hypothetical protein
MKNGGGVGVVVVVCGSRNPKAIFEHAYEEPRYVLWIIEWLDY